MSELAFEVENIFQVGQPIKLRLVPAGIRESGAYERDRYPFCKSRILKLLSDEVLVVWPNSGEASMPVSVGQEVTLEVKCSQGTMRLDSVIVAAQSEPVKALHIRRSGAWSRSQLRLDIRMEVATLEAEAFFLHPKEGLENKSGEEEAARFDADEIRGLSSRWIEARLRDLSAGGMLLASTIELEPGALISVSFSLGDGRPRITATAQVVWSGLDELARIYRHKAGCKFLDLRTGDQDRIVRFIFAKQTQLRRWGLL